MRKDQNDAEALVAIKAQAALEAVEECLRSGEILEDPPGDEVRTDLLKARRALYDVLTIFNQAGI